LLEAYLPCEDLFFATFILAIACMQYADHSVCLFCQCKKSNTERLSQVSNLHDPVIVEAILFNKELPQPLHEAHITLFPISDNSMLTYMD
jgi:hypothetical protein